MRWSTVVRNGVRVGLSGTSLALAMGCSTPEDVANREPETTVEVELAATETENKPASLVDQERERAKEAEERARVEQARTSSDPSSPWFLRPAGETTPASVQQSEQDRAIRSDPPQPVQTAKPLPPQPQPVVPIGRKPGWQHRAACGRG